MSESMCQHGALSRRGFLKTTVAAAGAAVALGGLAERGKANADESQTPINERVFSGACRGNCCGGCALDLTVRDGHLVSTYFHELPEPEYNHRICLRGLSHVQRVYSKDRLKFPLRRVEGTERGAGEWERVSWEEAIDEICTKWKGYRDEYGPQSLLAKIDGGNFASVHGGTGGSLFINAMEAAGINGAVDNILINASVDALGMSESWNMNELSDIANAKTIIAWGADVADSYLQAWRFFADAKENGAKLIVIDPIFTTLASKADIYVPIRPGSDAALAMAMIKLCMDEALIDVDFVRNSTVAPLLVKGDGSYLRGSDVGIQPVSLGVDEKTGKEKFDDVLMVWDEEQDSLCPVSQAVQPRIEGSFVVDGIAVTCAYQLLKERVAEWTPEKAQEITDVPADTIREITRIYARETPATIFPGYGIDHYTNGEYSMFSIVTLAMVTGNLGKSGATCGLVMPLETLWANQIPRFLAGTKSWGNILAFDLADVLKSKNYLGRDITIKSMLISHGNWFSNRVSRTEVLEEIIPNIEFIVAIGLDMTDSTRYADIVLPAAHWFEVNDLFGAYSPQPYLMLQEQAIEPAFECKPDFEIQKLLLKGMGVGEPYWDLSEEDFMRMLLDGDAAKAKGITLERLRKEKVIRLFPDSPQVHAKGGVFPTATGRAQFYLETPHTLFDYGQEWDYEKAHLPVRFEPPSEAWSENPLYEKYPLSVIQQHAKWRTHTQWSHVPWLKELDPEPVAKVNPNDATARGIKDGDLIRVFNDRGHVVLRAVYSAGIRPGVIDIPKGWQEDQFVEGHYQTLTSKVTSPVYVNSPFYDVLVEMEKYSGNEGEK